MTRPVLTLLFGAAAYGFAIGSVHSTTFALRNVVKFPALLLVTAAVCAPGFVLITRLVAPTLGYAGVRSLVLGMTRDLALLLASLATVSFFLAQTLERASAAGLGQYPLFLSLNVGFIAVAGVTALAHRGRSLLARSDVARWRGTSLLLLWLGLALAVGGQWAWYLRPFFGVATISADKTPFCLGTEPDFRGARSFYEALVHVVVPPR